MISAVCSAQVLLPFWSEAAMYGKTKCVASSVLNYPWNKKQNLNQFKWLFQCYLCCKGRKDYYHETVSQQEKISCNVKDSSVKYRLCDISVFSEHSRVTFSMGSFLLLKLDLFICSSDCLNYKANGGLAVMCGIFYLWYWPTFLATHVIIPSTSKSQILLINE